MGERKRGMTREKRNLQEGGDNTFLVNIIKNTDSKILNNVFTRQLKCHRQVEIYSKQVTCYKFTIHHLSNKKMVTTQW